METKKSAGKTRVAGRAPPAPPAQVRPSIPRPPEMSPIAVQGNFIESVYLVTKTAATLHFIPARTDDEKSGDKQKVLAPFTEVRLGGVRVQELPSDPDQVDPPPLFTTNLTLENLAFVLVDLSSDLKRMCQEICTMSGDLTVDPARMAHVRYFVAHLERQARFCKLRLDQRYGTPEEPAE